MKLVRQSWDFLFGALLIGGAPLCVMTLTVILGGLYESLFQVIISEGISFVVFGVMFITAVAAFAYAIRVRLRRRLLPRGILVLEVLLGTISAFFLFSAYGVIMVYAIHHWLRVRP